MANTALSAAGVAKQTAKGAPAANPAYWAGVTGGSMLDAEVDQAPDEITTGMAGQSAFGRNSVSLAADYSTFLFPKYIGTLLLGVLGNRQTTGEAAPYTHVFTLGDTVPYLSFFSKLDAELRCLADAKIDELSFAWDSTGAVEVNIGAMGAAWSYPESITPVADESLAKYFRAVGGTYKYDIDGNTLATAKVLGGSITFKRNVEADVLSASVVPDDVHEGALEAEVELKIRAASLADVRTILTGTANGSTISNEPVYGSYEVEFMSGTDKLKFAASKVPFTAQSPEADPAGGPLELTLTGPMLIPDGATTPVTATLINSVASY